MADSIKFTIGGQLGPSYRGALSQSIAEARVANQTINSEARKAAAIASGAAVDMSRLGQFKAWKAEYIAARAEEQRLEDALLAGAQRRTGARNTPNAEDEALLRQQGLIRVRIAEIAAQRAASAENDVEARASLERLQIRKKEWAQKELYNNIALGQIAKEEAAAAAAGAAATEAAILNVARGYGARAGGGGGGHGHGGIAGIIRESLVIVREISMGRGNARVAGSVTLLAQYLGLLNKVVTSTASTALLASKAETALSLSMNRAALAARGTAAYTALAEAALKQETVAAKAATEAEIALAAAKVSINPLGWVLIAGVAITAALAGIVMHMHKLATEAKNLHDLLDPLHKKFTEQADAVREASSQHQKYLDYLTKIGDETEKLPDKIEEVIKKLREQSQAQIELARARGDNKMAIEAMEEAQLKEELRITTLGKLQAQRQLEDAQSDLADKEAKYNAGVGDAASLHGTQQAAKNAGEILDAIQDAFEAHPTMSVPDPDSAANAMGGPAYKNIPTSENTLFTVKIGEKEVTTSLAKAKAAYNRLSTQADSLASAQQNLKDVFEDAKSTLKERNDAVKKLSKAERDYQDELGIKQTLGRQIAAAGGGRGGVTATAWEKAGLGGGGHAVSMLDLGKQQLAVQHKIERNTAHTAKHTPHRDGRVGEGTDHGNGIVTF